MPNWMPAPEHHKRIALIGAGGLVLILLIWVLSPSSSDEGDPDMAAAEQLARDGDAGGFQKAIETVAPSKVAPYYYKAATIGPSARPIIKSGWSSPDRNHQIAALNATPPWLRDASDRKEVEAISINSKEPAVRQAAINALASMKAWDSLPTLLKQMDDPDVTVRKAAASAVKQIAFLAVDSTYKADDLPGQRQKAIAGFRAFIETPGRRERYQEWLKEKGLDKTE